MNNIAKEFKSEDEAIAYTMPILEAGKHFVDAIPLPDGVSWRVTIVEKKNYLAHDGKEYTDEVWMDEGGELHLIQDLTEAHAKNIIRFMLRSERQRNAMMKAVAEQLAGSLGDILGDMNEDEPEVPNSAAISSTTGKILH